MVNRSIKRALSTLLTLALVFFLFSAIPLTAKAQTVEQVVEEIENYGYAGTGSLSAEVTGAGEITVSGIVKGIGHGLVLDISPDLTLIWRADLSGNADALLKVIGKGTFIMEGGIIESTNRIAINTDCDVIINNGTIKAKTIAVYSSGDVTINGGMVKGGWISISAGVNSSIIINGGLVQAGEREYNSIIDGSAQISGGTAIESGGSITINGGIVSAADGIAIRSSGSLTSQYDGFYTEEGYETAFPRHNKVTVNGGTVSSTTGTAIKSDGIYAIRTNGYGPNLNITMTEIHYNDIIINGGMVSATDGTAIIAGDDTGLVPTRVGSIAVNGGVVFAHGSDLLGTDIGNRDIVICIPKDQGSVIFGDGVLIAWNRARHSLTYEYGAADNLLTDPADVMVQWARSGDECGIEYHNGENSGFIPVSSVTVIGSPPDNDENDASSAPAHPFEDVGNEDWCNNAVQYVYDKGLMIGTSAKQFSPNAALSRSMIVTILYRNDGEQDVFALDIPFDDVKENEWYTDAVKWAVSNGIVLGYGDGMFGINDPVTKEQLATLIYRTQQVGGKTPPDIVMDKEWPDWNKISDYAKGPVNVLTIQCVFRDLPYTDGNFNPQAPATRAEVASILYRYLTAIE